MNSIEHYIHLLEIEFLRNENKIRAKKQGDYLRNQFELYGLTAPQRKEVQQPFLIKDSLPQKTDLSAIIEILWQKPQREFHYFSQELAFKFIKNTTIEDLEIYEYMITHNSWWDTVDFIAVKLVGNYFKLFPNQIEYYLSKWMASNNIWLQRTALLYQLKYKSELNTRVLEHTIYQLLVSKDFFINKAIGWVLREYSRTNPNWVTNFVLKTPLQPLSKKEALRLIL